MCPLFLLHLHCIKWVTHKKLVMHCYNICMLYMVMSVRMIDHKIAFCGENISTVDIIKISLVKFKATRLNNLKIRFVILEKNKKA